MKVIANLLLVLGILCLIYYGIIIVYTGPSSSFSWFWLLAGVISLMVFVIIRYMLKYKISLGKLPSIILATLILVGLCGFIMVEGLIVYHASRKADPKMDYLIVLGAQVKGRKISKSLHKRLKIAERYLIDNPDTLVIVSGGQGPGEDISEALAMKNYLISNEIAAERIIMEDQSTSTLENIIYSKKFLNNADAKVAVVTNGFHIFRSLNIARKQGITNVQGLSAPTEPLLLISYYVREALAVFKDFAMGNM